MLNLWACWFFPKFPEEFPFGFPHTKGALKRARTHAGNGQYSPKRDDMGHTHQITARTWSMLTCHVRGGLREYWLWLLEPHPAQELPRPMQSPMDNAWLQRLKQNQGRGAASRTGCQKCQLMVSCVCGLTRASRLSDAK